MTATANRLLLVSCPVHECRGWARTDENRVWVEEQRCPDCGARFQVSSVEIPTSGDVQSSITLLRLPTYDQEHVEVRLDEAFLIGLTGRLDLFASEILEKAWKSLPLPRRAVFDLTQTTELSPKGVVALLGICAQNEEDGRAVILVRAEDPEQERGFAGCPVVNREKSSALNGLGELLVESRWMLTVTIRREAVVATPGPAKKSDSVDASQKQANPVSPARRRRIETEDIGDVTVVNFVDKKILDEQNIQAIGEQLFRLVDVEGRRKILLNLSNVEYLSSAAMGKLLTLFRKAQHAGGVVILCNMDPGIYEVFEITRYSKIFRIYRDEQTALQAF